MVWKTGLISVLIAFSLVVSGCGYNLKQDASIASTEAGYTNADFYAKDRHRVGIASVSLQQGDDLNSIALSIQGYFKGTVRIATTCRPDVPLPDSFRYQNSERIPIFLAGRAESSCGISFVVSPEYPRETRGPLRIYSFVGHLHIRVLGPDQPWIGYTSKVPAVVDPSESIFVEVGEATTADVAFQSDLCGVKFGPTPLPVVDKKVEIPLKALMPIVNVKTCVLNGVVFTPAGPIRVSWFVNGYDTRYSPLPIPTISYDKKMKHIIIEGVPAVSVISMDNEWDLDNKTTFAFDKTKPHTLRLITVKGRLVVGEYSPGKDWIWTL